MLLFVLFLSHQIASFICLHMGGMAVYMNCHATGTHWQSHIFVLKSLI